jgi:hypothetical protein
VLLGQFEAIPLKLTNAVTATVVHFPDLHKGNTLDYKMHCNTPFLELTNFNQVNQLSCLSKVTFHSTTKARRSIRVGEEDNEDSETLQDTSGL